MEMEGCVAWPEEFVKEYKEKGYWEDVTLGERVDEWCEKYADRVAVVHEGQEVTFRQMDEYVTKIAYHLVKMGIKTYDRVIFQLFNGPEVVYLTYACFKIGAIPVCSLATHRYAEISFFAKLTEAKAHFIPAGTVIDFDYEEFADQLREEIPSLEHVVTVGTPQRPNMVSVEEMMNHDIDLEAAKKELAQYRPDPFEPALFQLSGGTTGVPKIIPRHHSEYYYNSKLNAIAQGMDENDRFLAFQPMMHNSPMSFQMLPIHLMGGAVIPAAPKPDEIIRGVVQDKATMCICAGPFAEMLLAAKSKNLDLGSLRKCWIMMTPPEKHLALRTAFNIESLQLFGMAEGFGTCTRVSDSVEITASTLGRPLSEADEVRIVSPGTEDDLPVGEIGEMICRGPYTLRGYYKAEERNKEAFTSDGFYRSGDLCKLDAQGNMIWCGRIKDCIDRGGEKVSAEEVEGHVMAFPKVRFCLVVAMPDKIMNERICVFVIPNPGEVMTLEELRDFLLNERKIAKFKAPERLEFMEVPPMTHVGK
ncbi:MAG: AMP-binding protein, partial [Chloroflexi bacterium]|nr:AMP-binding protein [Chloroflexota bacterium]